ncbi:MAG: hypothetical protein MHM6MM_001369 [Cercozoa sp. M6MM]
MSSTSSAMNAVPKKSKATAESRRKIAEIRVLLRDVFAEAEVRNVECLPPNRAVVEELNSKRRPRRARSTDSLASVEDEVEREEAIAPKKSKTPTEKRVRIAEPPSTRQVSSNEKEESATSLKTSNASEAEHELALLQIASDMPLSRAFDRLISAGVRSAPVWDASAQRYVGFLDVRELVSFAYIERDTADVVARLPMWRRAVLQIASKLRGEKDTAGGWSQLRPIQWVLRGSPLLKAAELLADDAHRIAVLDRPLKSGGHVHKILSQSSLLRYVEHRLHDKTSERSARLRHLLQSITIREAKRAVRKFYSSPVHAVNENDSARFMLRTMEKYRLSALPVVDDDLRLVGNISPSDLRLWLRESHTSLNQTIGDFLAHAHALDVQKKTRFPFCHVTPSDTLMKVVEMMVRARLHRVFVVDEKTHTPAGVLSVSDLLRSLVITTKDEPPTPTSASVSTSAAANDDTGSPH